MKTVFSQKNILVTGGVGSIGSKIVEKLLKNHSPKQVRIFDNNEEGVFGANIKFNSYPNARFLIGDIRDKERVGWAMREVDIVFHTAALKHVALSEYNPFEAVKTNVLGTENLCMAAIRAKAKKFINISTDKATNPTSTMGASKLLAERITAAANHYKGKSKTVCASVRFGNVIGSSGSVIPIFLEQIKKGGPITITDKRMIRYFMTTAQAVDLIFEATKIAQGGEVFILKMSALKIKDLAEVLLKELALKYGYKAKQIKIKEVGARPGEKLYERLLSLPEAEYALEMRRMFVIPPVIENPNLKKRAISQKIAYWQGLGAKPIGNKQIKTNKLLNKVQIKKLLKDSEIL